MLNRSLTGRATGPTVRSMYSTSTKGGQMKSLNMLAAILVIVGGLNWGLVAIAEFDLVAWIFGEQFGTTNAASRIVYGLVGLSAVYLAVTLLTQREHAPVRGNQAATAAH